MPIENDNLNIKKNKRGVILPLVIHSLDDIHQAFNYFEINRYNLRVLDGVLLVEIPIFMSVFKRRKVIKYIDKMIRTEMSLQVESKFFLTTYIQIEGAGYQLRQRYEIENGHPPKHP